MFSLKVSYPESDLICYIMFAFLHDRAPEDSLIPKIELIYCSDFKGSDSIFESKWTSLIPKLEYSIARV